MMIHHVKEFQIRLLVILAVLILGMVVGYYFYEPLFAFIKAPLNGPLHYTSPSGSFSFVIKICLLIGTISVIPIAVYNVIMFIQPALRKRLSRARVYFTTLFSLLLAALGAAFAFLIIIPLALQFFYKFQVDGLVALISADDYLKFVVSVIITFVLIFQLPLLISLIDHIKPLPPKKLFKAEKWIIVGSVTIGVLVPFAFDPFVQLLIASPIIILYNLSIVIVIIQHRMRARSDKKALRTYKEQPEQVKPLVATPVVSQPMPQPRAVPMPAALQPSAPTSAKKAPVFSDFTRRNPTKSLVGPKPSVSLQKPVVSRPAQARSTSPARPARLITDMRPPLKKAAVRTQLRPPTRTIDLTRPMGDMR